MSDTGWILWNGGQCPVQKQETVEVRLRSGARLSRPHAGNFCWHHYQDQDPSEIVAYRKL